MQNIQEGSPDTEVEPVSMVQRRRRRVIRHGIDNWHWLMGLNCPHIAEVKHRQDMEYRWGLHHRTSWTDMPSRRFSSTSTSMRKRTGTRKNTEKSYGRRMGKG